MEPEKEYTDLRPAVIGLIVTCVIFFILMIIGFAT